VSVSQPTKVEVLPRTFATEWLPIIAGLLLLYVPTFVSQSANYWVHDDHAHGPIILAVVCWLAWDGRRFLLSGSPVRAPGAGFSLLAFGLLVYVLGRSQDVALFEVGSLIPVLAGVLLVMRGWQGLRGMWFMLFFIVYLLPLPGFLVNAMTMGLKQDISAIASQVLYAVGYPVAHDGVIISIGQYQLLVSDACSGINSMFSLSAIGLLYLYVMRYRNWAHIGLIVASLLPIAFFANIARVIFIVLVTYHFGDAAGQGFVHGFSGIVLFVVALLAIVLLDTLLSRFTRTAEAP
jgi:exosortase B